MTEETLADEMRAIRADLNEIKTLLSGKAEDKLSLNQVEKQYQASRTEIREDIRTGKLPSRSRIAQGGKRGYWVLRSDAARLYRVRGDK